MSLEPQEQPAGQKPTTGLEHPLELLANWSLLTVIGYLLGQWLGDYAASPLAGISVVAGRAAQGLVLGLVVGACQWWLLTPRLPVAWPWIPLTAGGFAASLVAEELAEMAAVLWGVLGMVAMVASATLVGLSQWVYLRRHFAHAGWWIVALAAYGFVRYVLVRTTFLFTPAVWVYDLLAGILLAAATGYAILVYLDRLPALPARAAPRFRSLRPRSKRRVFPRPRRGPDEPARPAPGPARSQGPSPVEGTKPGPSPGSGAPPTRPPRPAASVPTGRPATGQSRPGRPAPGDPAPPAPAGAVQPGPVDPAWSGLIPGQDTEPTPVATPAPPTQSGARPRSRTARAATADPGAHRPAGGKPPVDRAAVAGTTSGAPAPDTRQTPPAAGTRHTAGQGTTGRPDELGDRRATGNAPRPAGTEPGAAQDAASRPEDSAQPPGGAGVKIARQVRLTGDELPRQVMLLKKNTALAPTAAAQTTALGFGFEMARRPRRARLRMAYTGMTAATRAHFRQHVELNGTVLYELQPRGQKLQETTEYALRIPPERFARTNQLVFVSRSGGTPQQKNPFRLHAVILDLDW